ncbi:MAG TPA: DUF2490 domain-containing protein [Blastocatellia bacterium]|nr:DUF2490 domain-containing protein [Blastocatellia bacterium]
MGKSTFRYSAVLTVIALLVCNAYAQSGNGSPRDDTQWWNDFQVTFPVSKKIDFNLLGGLRLGRDLSHFVNERAGGSFTFKAGKYLSLSPGYLYIATQPVAGRKGYENRLMFAGTMRFPLGRFSVSDRNQFERRFRNPIDSTRYRNRLQIEHPLKIDSVDLKLFASDEVYYDRSVNRWVRNRFSIGGGKTFNENLTIELYYLRQNDGLTRPGDVHAIGTAFRVRL